MSKKQTAVEWLREQFHKVPFSQFGAYFEQAIEMEREQIEEAVREGYDADRTVKKWKWIGQDYYEQTYEKEEGNE